MRLRGGDEVALRVPLDLLALCAAKPLNGAAVPPARRGRARKECAGRAFRRAAFKWPVPGSDGRPRERVRAVRRFAAGPLRRDTYRPCGMVRDGGQRMESIRMLL